jgi:hypothetical protein
VETRTLYQSGRGLAFNLRQWQIVHIDEKHSPFRPRQRAGSAHPPRLISGWRSFYLEKGALNWHVEGRVERVTAGSVYFSLPWQEHGSVDEFEPGHYWHWVQLGLEGRIDRPRRRFGFHPDFGIPRQEAEVISALLTRNVDATAAGPRRASRGSCRRWWRN